MAKHDRLGQRAVAGITWTLIGSVLSNILRIGVFAVLARMLTPADFGVISAAMTVMYLAQQVRDIGVASAVVQRLELTRNHIIAAATFSLAIGVVLTAIVALFAGPICALYHLTKAKNLVRLLSILFILRSLSSVPSAVCQRQMRFGVLALTDLGGYVLGSATSIVLAIAGMGPWALAIGYVVETTTQTVTLLIAAPTPLSLRLRWESLRQLLGFGGGQSVARLANYFATQGDYIVVGHFLDSPALGFYTRAYELIRFPSTVFNNIAGNVLFSSFSTIQDQPARLGEAFRRVLFANAIILLPASAGLIVLAPEVIRLLMGKGWGDAVLPFQIMAVTTLMRTSYKVSGLVVRSSADVFRMAGANVFYAIAVIGGAMISVHWGIVGVSCTTALAVIISFLMLTQLALWRVPLGWGDILSCHRDGLVGAALAVAAALPIAIVLRRLHAGAAIVGAAASLAGAILVVGFSVLQIRRGQDDWVWLWRIAQQVARKKRKKKAKALAPDAPPPAAAG